MDSYLKLKTEQSKQTHTSYRGAQFCSMLKWILQTQRLSSFDNRIDLHGGSEFHRFEGNEIVPSGKWNYVSTVCRSRSLPPDKYSSSNDSETSEDSAAGVPLTDYDLENYKMNHKNRGVAIVINVLSFDDDGEKHREGSLVDAERLRALLTSLRFEVIEPKDARKKSIIKTIKEGESSSSTKSSHD